MWAASLIAITLAACAGDSDVPAGAISEGEAAALDEAAAMLDEQRAPVDAIAPPTSDDESESETAAQ